MQTIKSKYKYDQVYTLCITSSTSNQVAHESMQIFMVTFRFTE